MNYVVKYAESTESMYGFSAVILPLTKENLNEIIRIRSLINDVKALSHEIGSFEIPCVRRLNFDLLNNDFDANGNEMEMVEMTDDEYQEFRKHDEGSGAYQVEPASIIVREEFFRIYYTSKFTEDAIWSDFYFDEIEKMFKENLVV